MNDHNHENSSEKEASWSSKVSFLSSVLPPSTTTTIINDPMDVFLLLIVTTIIILSIYVYYTKDDVSVGSHDIDDDGSYCLVDDDDNDDLSLVADDEDNTNASSDSISITIQEEPLLTKQQQQQQQQQKQPPPPETLPPILKNKSPIKNKKKNNFKKKKKKKLKKKKCPSVDDETIDRLLTNVVETRAMLEEHKETKAAINIQNVIRNYNMKKQSIIKVDEQKKKRQQLLLLEEQEHQKQQQRQRQLQEQQQQQQHAAIIKIQSLYRTMLERERFHLMVKCIVRIQCSYRTFLEKRQYQLTIRSIIKVQSIIRAYHIQSQYVKRIQIMKQKEMKEKEEEKILRQQQQQQQQKRNQSIVKIQSTYRSIIQRQSFLITLQRIICIQSMCRSRIQRQNFLTTLQRIIYIQSICRSYINQNQYNLTKCKTIKIQAFVRAYLKNKEQQQQRQQQSILAGAIIKIQSTYRTRIQIQKFQSVINNIIRIQCAYRRYIKQKQYQLVKIGTTNLQSIVRSFIIKQRYQLKRKQIIKIQSIGRSFLVKDNYLQKRQCIIKIQSTIRSYQMQIQYKNKLLLLRLADKKNAAILAIQSFWRVCVAKRTMHVLQKEKLLVSQQQQQEQQQQNEKVAQTVPDVATAHETNGTAAPTASSTESSSPPPPPPSLDNKSNFRNTILKEQKKRRQANIALMRDKARTAFAEGNLHDAIINLTVALKIYRNGMKSTKSVGRNRDDDDDDDDEDDDYQDCTLLSNRAAALLLVGANDAAAFDCQIAIKRLPQDVVTVVKNNNTDKQKSNQGDLLLIKSKLLTQLGWCCIRMGMYKEAIATFELSIDTAQKMAVMKQNEANDDEETHARHKQYIDGLLANVKHIKGEIKHCEEALANIHLFVQQQQKLEHNSNVNGSTNSRINPLDVLHQIDLVLKTSPSNIQLYGMKVKLLSSMKRWRHVAYYCEDLALQRVDQIGCFTEDLTNFDPYGNTFGTGYRPNLINSKFFSDILKLNNNDSNNDDNAATDPIEIQEMLKLSPEAVGEAVLVLLAISSDLLPLYLQSLRFEERFAELQAAVDSLNEVRDHQTMTCDDDTDKKGISYWSWLLSEEDKLNDIVCLKHRGDEFFGSQEFEEAIFYYGECLKIDSTKGKDDDDVDHLESKGGRLNAVLHCCRAACFMALERYYEASVECDAAIRIHPYYMKAMLWKSRCYIKLHRLNDSIVTYKKLIEIVGLASTGNIDIESTNCIFGGPWEVSMNDLESVKNELKQTISLQEKVCGPKPPSRPKISTSSVPPNCPQKERVNWSGTNSGSFNDNADSDDDDNDNDDPYGFGASAKERRNQWTNERHKFNNGSDDPAKQDYQQQKKPFSSSNQKSSQTDDTQPPPRKRWNPSAGKPKSRRSGSSNNNNNNQQEHFGNGTNNCKRNSINTEENGEENHYTVLNVALNASAAEIKKAYRAKALYYHPDKNKSPDAPDKFRSVQLAYEILSDEKARRKYNRTFW